jgi:hypothetical protein
MLRCPALRGWRPIGATHCARESVLDIMPPASTRSANPDDSKFLRIAFKDYARSQYAVILREE